MDLAKIKAVVNSEQDSGFKERRIIEILAEDKDAIPNLLAILQQERKETNQLISDSNAELSTALLTLVEPKIMETTGAFVIGQIKAHYHKWQHRIRCCLKFNDLP